MNNTTNTTNIPAAKWPQVRIDPETMTIIDEVTQQMAVSRSQAIQMCSTIGAKALLGSIEKVRGTAAKASAKVVSKNFIAPPKEPTA